MADTKTSALAELTAAAAADLFMAVDVSDTSMAASGTNKKLTIANLFKSVPGSGTVAAPNIAFDGDTDTGWFTDTADTIALSVGGVEAFRAVESAGAITWSMVRLPVVHPTQTESVFIGYGATASASSTNNTAIGYNASCGDAAFKSNNIAIGRNANANHGSCVAIGAGTSVTNTGGVAIGASASASAGVALGYQISNTSGGIFTTGLNGASSAHSGAAVIGNGISSTKTSEFCFGDRMSAAGVAPSIGIKGSTSQYTQRNVWGISGAWVDSTDASRKSRAVFYASDFNTTERECFRIESSGTAAMIGFLGATAVIRQATTGETTGFTAGSGTAVNDDSTFTGNVGSTAYRISDIVKALKNYGLLAS